VLKATWGTSCVFSYIGLVVSLVPFTFFRVVYVLSMV